MSLSNLELKEFIEKKFEKIEEKLDSYHLRLLILEEKCGIDIENSVLTKDMFLKIDIHHFKDEEELEKKVSCDLFILLMGYLKNFDKSGGGNFKDEVERCCKFCSGHFMCKGIIIKYNFCYRYCYMRNKDCYFNISFIVKINEDNNE